MALPPSADAPAPGGRQARDTTTPTRTQGPTAARTTAARRRDLENRLRPVLAALLALATGVGTAWAQGAFPEWLSSSANSAGGWTVVVVPLLWWSAARALPAALLGALFFFLLNTGYAALSAVDGLTWSLSPTDFWVGVGFIAGPLVGIGVVWMRDRRDVRAAIGVAGLSGLLIGEGVYGLTVLPHTSAVYWSASVVVGAAVLLGWSLTRPQSWRPRVVALVGTALVVGAQTWLYAFLNSWTPEV